MPNVFCMPVRADRHGHIGCFGSKTEPPLADLGRHSLTEATLHLGERNPILWPLGAGQTGFYARHVQLEHFAEGRIGRVVGPKQTLFLAVALHQID